MLQERAAKPGWKGGPVHAALRAQLIAIRDSSDVPQRLRALWALHVTGRLRRRPHCSRLLDDRKRARPGVGGSTALRAHGAARRRRSTKFAALAKDDPSPVVRLYLASALQRLPLEKRWAIAEGLVSHDEDATDANLPLMDWYGIEPLRRRPTRRGR